MPDAFSDAHDDVDTSGVKEPNDAELLTRRIADLQAQERSLQQKVTALQEDYEQRLNRQQQDGQKSFSRLVEEGTLELTQRRQALQIEIEQLERRQERIQAEMRTSFAGVSQDLAIRVQGFKDYLVGSLQDLATAAEQLQLMSPEAGSSDARTARTGATPQSTRSPQPLNLRPPAPQRDTLKRPPSPDARVPDSRMPDARVPDARIPDSVDSQPSSTPSRKRGFEQDAKQIRQLLDQYRLSPDYYGMPWQLRRTFEPIHAERVSQWFFDHAGRGSLKSMGSRLQNILVASAIISVLRMMKGDRVRLLILSDSPERLGEWRRGLQDCLGISRSDFGARNGIALFEAPEAVCQRADRLVEQEKTPFILIDNSEDKVHLSLLQYPLWLAFAPDPNEIPIYY